MSRSRAWVLAEGGLAFALLFFAHAVFDDLSEEAITLLFVLPVALIAVQLGMSWGFAAGLAGAALQLLWDLAWVGSFDDSIADYVVRGATVIALGVIVGLLADRVRQVSAERARHWRLSAELLSTAGFDGYLRELNPAWERRVGWTPDELRAKPYIEFIHPDDRARTEAEAVALTTGEHQTRHFENRFRCRDGSYRVILWSATGIPDEGLIYGSGRDITDRQIAERRFKELLEAAPDGIVAVDGEGGIVLANAQMERLFGYSREELIGAPLELLVPEELGDSDWKGAGLEVDARRKDGSVMAVEMSLSPMHGPDETLLMAAIRDVTERRRIERAVESARAEAERANQAKSEFLSRMSHELRTPLNAVIGFGQLLELDDLEPQQREGVDQILKGGRHLLELINEVLDISRIEAGTMSMSLEPVHLASVLAESVALIQPLATADGITLGVDEAELGEVHVLGDQQRLKQVLINLLSNAIKYNRPGGSVRVGVSSPSPGRVELAIVDSGRGMTPEQLERLFEPFDRLGAEQTEIDGIGLGLPLSKRLLDAMSGTIEAESERGVGTTVRVGLQGAREPRAGAPTAPLVAGELIDRRTIVYIEDNLSNVTLVEGVLAHLPDVRLIPAMQGKLGLELVREFRPDVVLVDLHLPDLDGHEVLEQLKADPATADLPVVVLSADATASQVARLRAAGAANYLTKPLDVERLMAVLAGDVAAPAS